MPERFKEIVKRATLAIAGAGGIFSQVASPVFAEANCLPVSKVFTGRTIHFNNGDFELPEGYKVRAVHPNEPLKIKRPEPCFAIPPTIQVSRVDFKSYRPYALIDLDGNITHTEEEGEKGTFDPLIEALSNQITS